MYTLIFSIAPFSFVVLGIKTKFVKLLTALLIAFEAFCNFIRVFDGLYNDGYPSEFLGKVTGALNTGTYETAILLAFIMALLLCSVFYASFNELNKR